MNPFFLTIAILVVRFLSGWRQGTGYHWQNNGGKLPWLKLWLITMVAIFVIGLMPSGTWSGILAGLAWIAWAVQLGYWLRLIPPEMAWLRDTHFWESQATGWPVVLAMVAVGWSWELLELVFYLVLTLPLGMVLFKGMVNLGTGRPFLDSAEKTDLADGSGWTIPFLGLVIPRPFSNGWTRAAVAGLGLVVWLLAVHLINEPGIESAMSTWVVMGYSGWFLFYSIRKTMKK